MIVLQNDNWCFQLGLTSSPAANYYFSFSFFQTKKKNDSR
jgi:hypothetical protein